MTADGARRQPSRPVRPRRAARNRYPAALRPLAVVRRATLPGSAARPRDGGQGGRTCIRSRTGDSTGTARRTSHRVGRHHRLLAPDASWDFQTPPLRDKKQGPLPANTDRVSFPSIGNEFPPQCGADGPSQLIRGSSRCGQPSSRAPRTAACSVNQSAGFVGSYPVSACTRLSR